MENLEKDGYEFQDIEAMARKMLNVESDAEERLSDYCYFYDGQTGEIRMCA